MYLSSKAVAAAATVEDEDVNDGSSLMLVVEDKRSSDFTFRAGFKDEGGRILDDKCHDKLIRFY